MVIEYKEIALRTIHKTAHETKSLPMRFQMLKTFCALHPEPKDQDVQELILLNQWLHRKQVGSFMDWRGFYLQPDKHILSLLDQCTSLHQLHHDLHLHHDMLQQRRNQTAFLAEMESDIDFLSNGVAVDGSFITSSVSHAAQKVAELSQTYIMALQEFCAGLSKIMPLDFEVTVRDQASATVTSNSSKAMNIQYFDGLAATGSGQAVGDVLLTFECAFTHEPAASLAVELSSAWILLRSLASVFIYPDEHPVPAPLTGLAALHRLYTDTASGVAMSYVATAELWARLPRRPPLPSRPELAMVLYQARHAPSLRAGLAPCGRADCPRFLNPQCVKVHESQHVSSTPSQENK